MGSKAPGDWPDLAGRIEGDRHVLPIRVYFEDTDFTGLVYHPNFLRFFERGRSDFLRLLGINHNDLLQDGGTGEPAVFVVRRIEIDYLRPASIDELIEISTRCAEVGGAKLVLSQEARRDQTVLAKAEVTVVLISRSGRPQRLGALVRDAFERFVNRKSAG